MVVETQPSRWTPAEDALLKELKACHTSWQSISYAIGHRPVTELKRRWDDLSRYEDSRNRSLNGRSYRKKFYENPPSTGMSGDEEAPRNVSCSDPLIIGGDMDYAGSRSLSETKRVLYIDREISWQEAVLLHQIAAGWERERWVAISGRFNGQTGRTITPEQARSVLDH
ncbi:hypothetical protein BDW42DRAFT_190728 [Aspergillus taichungensis]|uniref:Myb-like domain-containing protein n=1 Tax=Aspergillus taichungensis TaxID=482145 RepID=A0A2J5I6C5_9EURO|nr:hypothetical protein BDW42DRAFT_190728 [Aspergillus taichungensis]